MRAPRFQAAEVGATGRTVGDSRMTDDPLSFLVDWYDRHCDGDWEHYAGVRISTLANPGWAVDVCLADTELDGAVVEWVKQDDGESWLFWR